MPPQNTLPQNTAGGISFGISNLEPNDWETVDPGDWETVNPPAPPSPQFYQSPFSLQQQDPWSSSPQPTATPPMQEEQDPWYHPDRLIPMGLRVGGGVTGGILGGAAGSIVPGAGTIGGVALGGGAGSYIGDALAQGYEYLRGDRPEGYNVKSGLVEGGLGAIPLMGKAPGLTAGAKELFKYAAKAPVRGAIEGGALGAASPVAHSLVERGEFPSWSEVGQGAGVGAGIGAVTAGGLASVPAVRRGRAAQSASTARAASRTNAINDILSGVETPVLPPVRPEGTVDLPVTKRTPVVPPQAFEPGTQVMIHDLPGVYEVQGSVSPETTAVRAPDGPPTIVRNERIIPIDEAPAISGYDPDRGIQWTSETWRQHVEQMGPNQDLMVSAIEDTLDRPMSVDDRIAANQKLDELEGAIDKGLQFVDPNTGEMRTASEAQPGDIPLPAAHPDPSQENVRDLHAEAENWERDQSAGPAVDPRIVANLVRQVTGQDVNVYGMQGGNLTPRTDTPAPPSRQITSGQPEILSERDYAQTVQHGDTVEVAIPETGQIYWIDNIVDDAQITEVNNKIRNGQLEIVQKAGGITQRNVTPQRRATKRIGSMELGPSPAEALPVRPDTANEVGRSVPPEPTVPPESVVPVTESEIPKLPELPQNLKGAKPRFNIGTRFYLPQFASDLDKALYIIAQTKPSKQDAQYLKFVMDNTGLDEVAARALGQQVRGQVRKAVDKHTSAGGGSGAVEIPIIASQIPSESGGIPSSGNVDAAAPPSTATGGAGGIPPIIPPVITGGTGEGGGQNIPPPGPPNAPGSMQPPPPQPPPGPDPRQPGGVMPQVGPTRRPTLGPVMPGTGRMVNAPQPVTPWDTAAPVPPAQPAGIPPQLGPTRLPQQGPRRPRQPYVEQNPQLVQDLQNRIRKALEQQNPNVGPGDINKMLAEMQQVIRENPDVNPNGIIRQVMGANKALLTSWDLSAPGRQGKAFILNGEWWKALPGMVKAWGSKGAADVIQRAIEDHPSGYFKRGVSQSGKPTKSFAELVGLELSETEEMFRSTGGRAFEKYTGIGKSSRAHTAFLNKLRSDMFANFMEAAKAAGRNPETDLNLARKYADFINDATGRSKVSGTLRIGKRTLDLNDAFFAPKNMVGQIKTWNNVLNLYRYKQHDPVLRKQALRSLFAVAGVGMMTAEAANQIPGVAVNHDPTSSDFMKIRIGQKRIDLFGGYQQFPVAAMQAILGQKTPTSGKNAGETQDLTKGGFYNRASEAERFFINRLSPVGGFVWAFMRGREFDGKPFEVKRALYERTLPIVVKDLTELAQSDPALAAMLSPLLITGLAGTQVYTGR